MPRRTRSSLAAGSIGRHMWVIFVGLVMAKKAKTIFSQNDLLVLEDSNFHNRDNVGVFLDWGIRGGKIVRVGGGGKPFRANIVPIDYLPEKVRPYLEERHLLLKIMRSLKRIFRAGLEK